MQQDDNTSALVLCSMLLIFMFGIFNAPQKTKRAEQPLDGPLAMSGAAVQPSSSSVNKFQDEIMELDSNRRAMPSESHPVKKQLTSQ